MTVQLDQPDFQRLTRIVQNLPDFANVRDRRLLVAKTLESVPQADVILARLDFDSAAMGVSVEVIRFLSQFGQVAYGKEALSVFLNYIQPSTGDEDSDFIVELFQKYPLDVPATPDRLTDRVWCSIDMSGAASYSILRRILRPTARTLARRPRQPATSAHLQNSSC